METDSSRYPDDIDGFDLHGTFVIDDYDLLNSHRLSSVPSSSSSSTSDSAVPSSSSAYSAVNLLRSLSASVSDTFKRVHPPAIQSVSDSSANANSSENEGQTHSTSDTVSSIVPSCGLAAELSIDHCCSDDKQMENKIVLLFLSHAEETFPLCAEDITARISRICANHALAVVLVRRQSTQYKVEDDRLLEELKPLVRLKKRIPILAIHSPDSACLFSSANSTRETTHEDEQKTDSRDGEGSSSSRFAFDSKRKSGKETWKGRGRKFDDKGGDRRPGEETGSRRRRRIVENSEVVQEGSIESLLLRQALRYCAITPIVLRKGDHIQREIRSQGVLNTVNHHGIYVGNGRVIHFSGNEESSCSLGTNDPESSVIRLIKNRAGVNIRTISVMDFMSYGGELTVVYYSDGVHVDPPKVVITRAETAFVEQDFPDYDIMFNNCEHFCRWCKTGKGRSCQVESAVLLTAGAASLVAAGALSALILRKAR